jgi:hypothetical protein
MEEYIKFLEFIKKKILLRKNIKEVFEDFDNQNSNIPPKSSLQDFFKIKEDSFKAMIIELRDSGEKEDEIELLINLEKEKRFNAYKSSYDNFSINNGNVSSGLSKKNKLMKIIVEKTITSKSSNNIELKPLDEKPKKFSEKWHAILYLLELQAANASPPENSEGTLIRDDIEEIGRQRIKGSKGQSFYRNVLKFRLEIKDKKSLKSILTDDWKEKIISLSNNDKIIIDYLEKNY